MSCKKAMIANVVKASPEQTVHEIMDVFKARCFNSIPVVDESDKLIGLFSMRALLKRLLPISAQIEGGLNHLDFISESEPGVAKKLRKLRAMKIGEVMEKDPPVLHPESPAWEAVRLMAERGSPIPVVEPETRDFRGLISTQSLLASLQKVLRNVEREEKEQSEE